MVEAESEANANAALLEAQALDIRAVSSAAAPEILEYRFQQDVLERLAAYEREWELTRKQRIDTLLLEIERSKKDRAARLIEVKEARNRARQDVARMLEEQETEAQRVRLEIETRGRADLTEGRTRLRP